ncbi:serum paraoxonase/arylesterase 2-like isoform X1 [Hypomesus transpacificus]|uniref:serum paraoxonase/arylesterase 2-like isoform X1 n=1 Tax=Hypomesus transpacificus TaxID=137520 RepID=UPI001F07B32F|nr:serum paraoxonase/arylesterase 2-like isoform X1 [Hypomesus transpacificus]
MNRLLVAVCVAAFAVIIGQRILKLMEISLYSREIPLKHLPNCQLLKHIDYGSEDLSILRDGLAIISTGLNYPGLPQSEGPGKIYTLDLLDPRLTPVELQIKGDLDSDSFNPHGISIFTDETDKSVLLFVVNHPTQVIGDSQVDIFRFVEEENAIVHLKTIRHDLLHRYVKSLMAHNREVFCFCLTKYFVSPSFFLSFSVNDIVAVGPESFYATNDHSFPNELLHMLTVILGLPWCNVIYYSPQEVKVVRDGFLSANGINISPDKRYLYVSDILDHEIEVFERRRGEGLVYIKSVAVGSLCDNIEVDYDMGDLWLGCHPNGAKLKNTVDLEDPPGSEVIRIQNILSEKPTVTQVYADDGHVIMGSSVAAPYGGKLLIGTVYHKALCCDLK